MTLKDSRGGKEQPVLDRLRNYLQVAQGYDFIMTVIAVGLAIYWVKAKIRQWRLEAVLRRIWEKRDKEIRFRRVQKTNQEPASELRQWK